MAVVSVQPTHTNRTADIDAENGGRIVRPYIVRTDSKYDGSLVVANAADLPNLGSEYSAGGSESSSNWIAKRIIPRQRAESPLVWDVDVEYEPREASGQGADDFDPQSQPTDYQWKTIQESTEMPVDSYGLKAQTTAGEPFEDAPSADKSYRELVITRNEASFSGYQMDEYVNTLNEAPIFGYDAKEGRIVSIDASGQYDPVFGGYWQVTYTIQFRKTSVWAATVDSNKILPNGTYPSGFAAVTAIGPWDIVKRNRGTMAKKAAGDAVAEPIIGTGGHQFSNGYDIAPNGLKRSESLGDPYYLVFRPYQPKNWTPLNL